MEQHKNLSKKQEVLIAAYLAGEDVSEQLLTECKVSPFVLKEVSTLISQQRLLSGEFDQLYNSKLFNDEVMARIEEKQQSTPSTPSLSNRVNQELIDREAANGWFGNPWSMAASIAVFVGFIFMANIFERQKEFATVTKIAATSTSESVLSMGNSLGQGDIELSTGFSELTFNNGVIVVLEAPVKLTLNSADRITVKSGKLVARVPQNAIGFRIDTPTAEIIDLGTEFGVDVNTNGNSQVHVLEGEVKARGNKKQAYLHAKKDQGLSFYLEDKVQRIRSNPKEFMRVLPGRSALLPNYLYWSFDEKQGDQFASINQGIDDNHYQATDKSKDEKVKQIEGVYGQAVEFNGNGNWLATDFPGIGSDDPRTVSFWLKVPSDFSTDNAYGIISWGLQQQYSSWQISPNPEKLNGELGRLRVGTYNAQVVGYTDLRDDQWHHIAVVMYGGTTSDISTHVLLYVDGKLEQTQNKSIAKVNTQLSHPESKPLSLGRNIGFHPRAEHERQNYFKGSVDELFIFEAALEQQQVQQLMLGNKLVGIGYTNL